MLTSTQRWIVPVLVGVGVLIGASNVWAQMPRSVPGTGQPGFTQPYYTPWNYPGYGYGYSYPYRSYYQPYSVPGTAMPAYPQPYYPSAPAYSAWRLGITGFDWPGVGVRINTVEPGSPAEQMGIEVTDVIVQVNGRPIRSIYDLQYAVAISGGYARILVLDSRTNTYMWHNGSLISASAATVPGSGLPAVPGTGVPGVMPPVTPTPATPGMPETPATPAIPGTPPTPATPVTPGSPPTPATPATPGIPAPGAVSQPL